MVGEYFWWVSECGIWRFCLGDGRFGCVYGKHACGEHVVGLFGGLIYLEALDVINRLRFSSTGVLVCSLEKVNYHARSEWDLVFSV